MSYSVDVNVLLYASDQASPHHDAASRFLANRTSDPGLFCVAWITLMGYVRIATHSRIFAQPLSPAETLGNVEARLRLPRTRVLPIVEPEVRAASPLTLIMRPQPCRTMYGAASRAQRTYPNTLVFMSA